MRPFDVKSVDELYRDMADTKLRIALTLIIEEDAKSLESQAVLDADSQREATSGKRTQAGALRMIDRQLSKNQIKRAMHQALPKVMNTAVAVILVLFLGVSTSLAVSSTVRVMRFIIEIEKEYTELSLQEDADASFDVQTDWLASYYPTYIPEGYRITDMAGTYGNVEIQYQNANGDIISFAENSEYAAVHIDTEDATTHSVLVNGYPATMVEKNGITTLIWSEDNRYYVLWADGDAEFVTRISASLRSVN